MQKCRFIAIVAAHQIGLDARGAERYGDDALKLCLLFAAALAVGCSSAPEVACTAGADCASGICLTDGTCAPVTQNDASTPDVDAMSNDASSNDVMTIDSPITGCVPNDAGTITASQAPLQPGLHAKFLYATNVTFSTAGTMQTDGSRIWDFTGALTGDTTIEIDTVPVTGAWYASSFATASYATQLSPTSNLLGVFQFGSNVLALQGVVSPSQTGAVTNVSYSPQAISVQFPLSLNATWSSTSTISGQASGVPVIYYENYQSKVDAWGVVKTPYGSFDVLRIATVLTHTVGASVTIIRSYGFFAQCATQVATLVSQADEPNAEFTSDSLVQRLTP